MFCSIVHFLYFTLIFLAPNFKILIIFFCGRAQVFTWCIGFVLYCRNSFCGRDSRPPPLSRRDRSSSAEQSSEREGSASGPNAPPSLLDLPKIPPPAIQEGGSDNRKSHGTEGHQGPPGPRFQGARGPPGPGKSNDLISVFNP